uniref:Uncharacterized protein n=1 Tax=Globodera rostochiensis TaxID=31243 RepID=A0A914H9J6_GLORO
MDNLWILILVSFFATNSLDKAESVQLEKLEELPLQTFDELFLDEWWDKDEAAEDLKTPPTNFGQNVHHQIDRQNTQIGQIEPNSTDQLGQIDRQNTQIGQIEPNSIDQNPPLTESDHSDNAKNGEEIPSNENIAEDERKRTIVGEFHAMKDEFKQKGKYSAKEWLGLSLKTIYAWKRKLGQTKPNPKYPHSEQKELMKHYYEIKDQNPKMSVWDIAKRLNIGISNLYRWKKQFKRQQFHSNSVDGHSVE